VIEAISLLFIFNKIFLLTCIFYYALFIERQEKQSVWPPGPYALPSTEYGCPESQSRGWLKSNALIGGDLIPFCVKFRNDSTLDQGKWIPGNYSIFKAGPSCPTGIY
jgi:hypothetical protein